MRGTGPLETPQLTAALGIIWESNDGSNSFHFSRRYPERHEWCRYFAASAGDDKINGRGGTDTLSGGNGDDELNGGSGTDTLNGGGSDDELNGGSGTDTLNGGSSDDVLRGGGGNDTLNGNIGDDELDGGSGNDTLNGNLGDDVLDGGGGDDVLDGGADPLSNDQLRGGLGEDLFVYAVAVENGGVDTIFDLLTSQGDTVLLTGISEFEFINAFGDEIDDTDPGVAVLEADDPFVGVVGDVEGGVMVIDFFENDEETDAFIGPVAPESVLTVVGVNEMHLGFEVDVV